MKIIRETERKIARMRGYDGICDSCGTLLTCDEELFAIVIADLEDRLVLVPIDRLVCPECNKDIIKMNAFKSMEVTGEIAKMEEKE